MEKGGPPKAHICMEVTSALAISNKEGGEGSISKRHCCHPCEKLSQVNASELLRGGGGCTYMGGGNTKL